MLDLNRQSTPGERRRHVHLIDLEPGAEDMRAAVIEGLSKPDKALPFRFLYDATGSALFDLITQLPEYYPTRTELGILRENATQIADALGPHVQLVELGSGSSEKVRILLDAMETPESYIPIDISRDHLLAAAQTIQDDYPDLQVSAIAADFAQPFGLPASERGRRVAFYPGSTIGNLPPEEARDFLAGWRERLGPGALLLIGVDLRKSAAVLEPAYDDSQGVTAAFSLNLLSRINRELGADFDLTGFRHEARYLEDEGRIAIHLVSLRNQTAHVGGQAFRFEKDERVHVEDSWKYSLGAFYALAGNAGFDPVSVWTDDAGLFSVHLLKVRG